MTLYSRLVTKSEGKACPEKIPWTCSHGYSMCCGPNDVMIHLGLFGMNNRMYGIVEV